MVEPLKAVQADWGAGSVRSALREDAEACAPIPYANARAPLRRPPAAAHAASTLSIT